MPGIKKTVIFVFTALFILMSGTVHASMDNHIHMDTLYKTMKVLGVGSHEALKSLYNHGMLWNPTDRFSMDGLILSKFRPCLMNDNTAANYDLEPWLPAPLVNVNKDTPKTENDYTLNYTAPEPDCYGGGLGITFKNGVSVDLSFSYLTDVYYTEDHGSGANMGIIDWSKSIYNPFAGLEALFQSDILIGSFKISFPLGGR